VSPDCGDFDCVFAVGLVIKIREPRMERRERTRDGTKKEEVEERGIKARGDRDLGNEQK
jgi:hypothetical protein